MSDATQRAYERLLTSTPEGREELRAFRKSELAKGLTYQEAKRALAASLKKDAEDRLLAAQPSWRKGLDRADRKSDGIVDSGVTKKHAEVSFSQSEGGPASAPGYWREVRDCDNNTFHVWCRLA